MVCLYFVVVAMAHLTEATVLEVAVALPDVVVGVVVGVLVAVEAMVAVTGVVGATRMEAAVVSGPHTSSASNAYM